MTKYPIKHTMEFGEEICPECGENMWPRGYKADGECSKCHGEGTIPLSVTFDLIKECPECGGAGEIDWSVVGSPNIIPPAKSEKCLHCHDNGLPDGKVHRYWTPKEAAEHIKKETGIDWEWPEDTQVYRRVVTPQGHKTAWELCSYWSCLVLEPWQENILHIFGQPDPPAND